MDWRRFEFGLELNQCILVNGILKGAVPPKKVEGFNLDRGSRGQATQGWMSGILRARRMLSKMESPKRMAVPRSNTEHTQSVRALGGRLESEVRLSVKKVES